MDHFLTRRRFLASGTAWAAASLFAGTAEKAFGALAGAPLRPPQGGRSTILTRGGYPFKINEHGMIVYSEEYITREMPASFVTTWITPTEHFFVRNNELMPRIDPASWTLSITGEVERPVTLSMPDLSKIEPRSVTNTLECAGNGRAFFQPPIRGVPWSRGGVGNAVFRGPSLESLLHLAGPKSTGRHVAFRGMTLASPNPAFMRSIPMEKALDPDTIVATEMNGASLAPEHGFPARALVPGWIGSASIKWLTEVRVLRNELTGYFMDSAYRLPAQSGAQLGTVITALPVKSIIAGPADGSAIEAGSAVRVFGAVWAGDSSVARVDVSTNGGKSWQPAGFGSEHARYSWRLWDFEWKPKAEGAYVIFSRATDSQGHSQPLETPWNPGGYLWNAVDRVRVTVGAAAPK